MSEMQSKMPTNESKIYFKCLANILHKNYLKESCKWNGDLSEYIQHVKAKHANMFHFIRGKRKDNFKWCLPCKEDQISTGIFNYYKLNFLFMLFYNYNKESLYFSLFNLNGETDGVKYYYTFTLGEGRCTEFQGCVNYKLDDVEKPISNHTHRTLITKNVLTNYMNDYREFRWSISLYTIKDICNEAGYDQLTLEDSE